MLRELHNFQRFMLWAAIPEVNKLHTEKERIVRSGTKTLERISMNTKIQLAFPVLVAFLASLSPFMFGIALGYTSPYLVPMTAEMGLSMQGSSAFASVINIGAVMMGMAASKELEAHGRKAALVTTATLFTLGFAMVAMADSLLLLILGRFVTGIGAGLANVVAPVYVAEIAPSRLRGFLGSFYQLAVCGGVLAAYAGGLFLSWREMAMQTCLMSFALAVGAYQILPETPAWLVSKGREGDAAGNLMKLDATKTEEQVYYHISNLRRKQEEERQGSGSAMRQKLANMPPYVRTCFILCGGMLLIQQFSGINSLIFFSGSILQSAGLGGVATSASLLLAVAQIVFTLIGAAQVDKLGRRSLLQISGAGMAAGMFLLASFYTSLSNPAIMAALGPLAAVGPWAAVIGLLLFISAFSLGWGPVPWLMAGELFSSEYRSMAVAMCTILGWGGSFCITQFFGSLILAIGHASVFWMFTGVCMFSLAFVSSPLFVETKGKTLEQIQQHLQAREAQTEDSESQGLKEPEALKPGT